MDKDLGEVGVDSPVSHLVCIGKIVPRDRAANAHVIELRLHGAKTDLDVAKAFAVGELGKCYVSEVILASERLDFEVASIPLDAAVEPAQREHVHDLREHFPVYMHPSFQEMTETGYNRVESMQVMCGRSFLSKLRLQNFLAQTLGQ